MITSQGHSPLPLGCLAGWTISCILPHHPLFSKWSSCLSPTFAMAPKSYLFYETELPLPLFDQGLLDLHLAVLALWLQWQTVSIFISWNGPKLHLPCCSQLASLFLPTLSFWLLEKLQWILSFPLIHPLEPGYQLALPFLPSEMFSDFIFQF